MSTCDQNGEVDQLRVGQQQHGERAAGNEQRIEPIEIRRFAKALIHARLHAQAFAHRIGGRKRQNRRRKERCIKQAEGEQDEGIVPGQRPMASAASDATLISPMPCTKSVAAQATMMNHAITSVKMQPTMTSRREAA